MASPQEIDGEAATASVPPERRSEVDDTYLITKQHWIVSLARKPNSTYQQHAFLIVEGIENDEAKIWFIDFVSNGGWQFGTYAGFIRIMPFAELLNNYPTDGKKRLIFSRQSMGDDKMMNPKPNDKLIAISWQVEASRVLQMIERVESDKRDKIFPRFVITGKDSIFEQSSYYSSPDDLGEGHNCFTWAKAQLATLNQVPINDRLNNKDEFSWFADISSRTLVDEQGTKSKYAYIASACVAAGSIVYYCRRPTELPSTIIRIPKGNLPPGPVIVSIPQATNVVIEFYKSAVNVTRAGAGFLGGAVGLQCSGPVVQWLWGSSKIN